MEFNCLICPQWYFTMATYIYHFSSLSFSLVFFFLHLFFSLSPASLSVFLPSRRISHFPIYFNLSSFFLDDTLFLAFFTSRTTWNCILFKRHICSEYSSISWNYLAYSFVVLVCIESVRVFTLHKCNAHSYQVITNGWMDANLGYKLCNAALLTNINASLCLQKEKRSAIKWIALQTWKKKTK